MHTYRDKVDSLQRVEDEREEFYAYIQEGLSIIHDIPHERVVMKYYDTMTHHQLENEVDRIKKLLAKD